MSSGELGLAAATAASARAVPEGLQQCSEHHEGKADESNNCSRDQHHDHGTVLNVVSRLERVVPVTKEF